MSVTQKEIAKEVGLDVSSVNKILNRVPGLVFKKETIKRVFQVARERGYNFKRPNKHFWQRRADDLERALRDLWRARESGFMISDARIAEIKELATRIGGAAVVILVLRTVLGL